jgi:protein TonB
MAKLSAVCPAPAVNTIAIDSARLAPGAAPEPAPASARPRETQASVDGPSVNASAPAADTLAHGWKAAPRKRGVWIAILALHGGLAWAMAHSLMQPAAKHPEAPVEVRLVEPPQPPKPQPQPPAEMRAPVVAPVPFVQPPPVNLAQTVVTVAEAPPVAVPIKPAAVTAPAAPPAAPSTGPKEIPASAVRYVAGPQLHVPRMSRKLGESGTVVLHVVVDATGLLKTATVRKSSGFDRLDQQALIDIRTARFEPYLDKGVAIEWEADAGLQYEVR